MSMTIIGMKLLRTHSNTMAINQCTKDNRGGIYTTGEKPCAQHHPIKTMEKVKVEVTNLQRDEH